MQSFQGQGRDDGWGDFEALLMERAYEDYTEHVEVVEKRVLLLSDVHLPYCDAALLQRAMTAARQRQVEAVVWLGDLLDCPTYSPWGNDDVHATFEHELQLVEGLIRSTAQRGYRQYWSAGNHEWRFLKQNHNQVGLGRLASMANLSDLVSDGSLVMSDNPTLDYRSSNDLDEADWLLIHPAQYGRLPLKVPGDIADKMLKNVASAHAHHWGMGTSPSGNYQVVETGGAFLPSRMKYVNYRVGDLRPWVAGYAILDHGAVTLYR